MKKLLIVLIFSITGLNAQAGKMEGSGFRVFGGLYSGSYESDFEKKLQRESILNGALETKWENKYGTGLNLGGQYFWKNQLGPFSGLMFSLQSEGTTGSFTSNTISSGYLGSNAYSGSVGRGDISVGGVLNPVENWRVTPRIGNRSITQSLEGSGSGIYSGGYLGFGGNSITSKGSSGYLGVFVEYDVKPSITLYLDTILLSPFLLQNAGEFSGSATSILTASNGYILGVTGASGTYSTKFNRFVLGSSFELDSKSKIFVQIENETIRTKVGDSAAFSLLSVSVSGSTASALDFTSSTFYSILSNSSSQSLTLNGLKVGYSFSF
jgi:hypothetical protein